MTSKHRALIGKNGVSMSLALIMLLFASYTASAQDTCKDPTKYTPLEVSNVLDRQSRKGCLSGENDKFHLGISEKILKLTVSPDEDPQEVRKRIGTAFQTLHNSIQQFRRNSSGTLKDIYGAMDETLMISIEELPFDIDVEKFGRRRWDLVGKSIQLSGNNPINLESYLSSFCTQEQAVPICTTAYHDMQTLLRHTNLVAHVLGQRFSIDMNKTKVLAQAYADQWEQYRKDTRTQYWPEMIVNEAYYSRRTKEGHYSPPPGQIIFLHPGISLEYAPETANNVVPAITLEVLGYNHWGWKGDKGRGKMGTGLGGSFILNFSKREDYSTISYGGMVHFKHIYSVGVTRGKGPNDLNEWKVILGLDVLKLFKKY